VTAALLLGSGAALARDLAADAPYPLPPDTAAASAFHKPQRAHAAAVPLPPAAARATSAVPVVTATAAIPLPKAAPQKLAAVRAAAAPKLASRRRRSPT
jgi:hypothetical protein